jgi:hypothetical protein
MIDHELRRNPYSQIDHDSEGNDPNEMRPRMLLRMLKQHI